MAENFYDKFYKHAKGKNSGTKKSKSPTPDEKLSTSSHLSKKNPQNQFSRPSRQNSQRSSTQASPSSFAFKNSLFLTDRLQSDTLSILNNFDQIVQGVRPLNSRQLQQLPDNIRALSHQLTDQRADRRLGYMNDNVQLSSYVRYYTWWNLIRLTRLFSNLPASLFPQKDAVCLDLGSGPLTLVIALWLACPQLRKLNLTWYCLDVSSNSMALGEDIYLSIAARFTEKPWQIIRVKGSFGTQIKQKADFVTCANMFNELDQAGDMPPEYQTKKYFDQLKTYATPAANFLLVEPGVPKASRTLSLLRSRFLSLRKNVLSPCPHAGDCPMNGFKAYTGSQNKWCNFAFSTEDAPAKLQKLSENAKLPKERATLSFLAVNSKVIGDDRVQKNYQATAKAGEDPENHENHDTTSTAALHTPASANHLPAGDIFCRVASDTFPLPGHKFGHYACSELGLVLLRTKGSEMLKSGDLISVKMKSPDSLPKDEKSGALIIDL